MLKKFIQELNHFVVGKKLRLSIQIIIYPHVVVVVLILKHLFLLSEPPLGFQSQKNNYPCYPLDNHDYTCYESP